MKISIDAFLKTIAILCDTHPACKGCPLRGERHNSENDWFSGCLRDDLGNEQSRQIVKNSVIKAMRG